MASDVILGIINKCCVSEKNICEHAIVCVKIVAECKEYELLETVAKQDTQDIPLHLLPLS